MDFTQIAYWLIPVLPRLVYSKRNWIWEKTSNHKILSFFTLWLVLPDSLNYLIFKFPHDKEMIALMNKVKNQSKLDDYFT